ncbi:unnamed protein product [Chrysoparadoxa australica]
METSAKRKRPGESPRCTIYSLRGSDVCLPASNKAGELRIVVISDTHGEHRKLSDKIPDGDILLHAGDFSTKLRARDVDRVLADFNDFMGSLPHQHKIVICGNHEIALNNYTPAEIQRRLRNVTYLQDSSTHICGLHIYGTPWTNRLAWQMSSIDVRLEGCCTRSKSYTTCIHSCNMGFSKRSTELDKIWAQIPSTVDILLTHMPPYNMLDLAYEPNSIGTWGLRRRVEEIGPAVHAFGHVHDSHGCQVHGATLFVNAAQALKEQPIFFNLIGGQASSELLKEVK